MMLKSLSAGHADSDGFRSYRVAPAPDTVECRTCPLLGLSTGWRTQKDLSYANYQGSSEIVKDFTINIVEKF